VYYAESVNGHDTTPFFLRSVISDHVIHRGTISTAALAVERTAASLTFSRSPLTAAPGQCGVLR